MSRHEIMVKIKETLNNLILSRYFWLNLLTSFFIVVIIQLIIYFGCKYDLLPYALSEELRLIVNDTQDRGIYITDATWRLPYSLEFFLFFITFLAVSYLGLRFKKKYQSSYRKKQNKTLVFRLVILFFSYCIFLANDKYGRKIFYSVLTQSFKDSFVINCPEKTIQLGSLKYQKEASVCKDLCSYIGKNCVYSGLDKDQPQFGDPSGRRSIW